MTSAVLIVSVSTGSICDKSKSSLNTGVFIDLVEADLVRVSL